MSKLNRLFDTHPPLEERIAAPARALTACRRHPSHHRRRRSSLAVPRPASRARLLAAAATTEADADHHHGRRPRPRHRPPPSRRPPRPLTGPAAGDPALLGPPGAGREDRQRRAQGPAAGRPQPGRRGVRGAGRGQRHPAPRHLPLHRRRAGRPGPLGPHLRPRRARPAAPPVLRLERRQRHLRRAHPRAANLADVGYDARHEPVLPGRRPARARQPDAQVHRRAAWRCPTDGSPPPPALFTYRAAGQAARPPRAGRRRCTVTYGTQRRRRPGRVPLERRRAGPASQKGTPHVDAAGVQVAPPNVIVQFVAVRQLRRQRPVRQADPRGPAGGRGRGLGAHRRRPGRRALAASRPSTPSPPTPTSTATRSASPPAAPGWRSRRPAAPPRC